MVEKGFQVSIPKSEPMTHYELFCPGKFPVSLYAKHPITKCPNADLYYNQILSFPTFSFHEYDLIDDYIAAIHDYMRLFL